MMTLEEQKLIEEKVLRSCAKLTREQLVDNLVWLTIAYKIHMKMFQRFSDQASILTTQVGDLYADIDDTIEGENLYRVGKNHVASCH